MPTPAEVRPLPFSDASIRNAITKAIENDPDAKHWAIVAVADIPGNADAGARLVAMYKLDSGWSFGGYIDKRYNGPLTGGVEVRISG